MTVNPIRRSTSTNTCNATNVPPMALTPGPNTFVKIPVVLQEVSVQIPMHAEIDFPAGQNVLEVKTVGKKTFITQCRLISRPGALTAKLYLSGFVRKNIQYAANPSSDAGGEILSQINSLTVEVPFDCVAEISSFLTPPVGPLTNTRDEFDYLVSHKLPNDRSFTRKDKLEGSDLSQHHQISTEYFNELPYCELIRADIIEIDESLDRKKFAKRNRKIVGEGTFTRLSEKMVLDLTVKLLQKQQVKLGSTTPCIDIEEL